MARRNREIIESRDNRWLKRFRAALRGHTADRGDAVGVEGPRLVREALRSGLELVAILVSTSGERHLSRLKSLLPPEALVLRTSDHLFASAADTESPQGIAALVLPRRPVIADLLAGVPLLVVLIGVQDPGNVGTVLRSAEAFGATGAVACRGTADPLGPKSLRASAGSAFRLPVIAGADADSLLEELRGAQVRICAASLDGEVSPAGADLRVPAALLIGNEGAGLGPELEHAADVRVRIPIAAEVDSLNAAVAASVLLYEAARQRGFGARAAEISGTEA